LASVRLAIARHLQQALDAPQCQPFQLLKDMIYDGLLGKENWQGFIAEANDRCIHPSRLTVNAGGYRS